MRLSTKLLDSLIMRQNWKTRHSVIIPLDKNIEIQEEFAKFKQFVLNQYQGIDEQLIQNPKHLHITICSFNTNNEFETLKSRVLLKHCFEERVKCLLKEKPLIVEIKGIDIWPEDPERTNVLYARVSDPSNKLQIIANSIANQFNEFRIFNKNEFERRPEVRLHITFMNAEYPQRISYNYLKNLCEWNRLLNNGFQDYYVFDDYKPLKRKSFNSKKIIDKYKDYSFCNLIIRNLVLNQNIFNGFRALESIQLNN